MYYILIAVFLYMYIFFLIVKKLFTVEQTLHVHSDNCDFLISSLIKLKFSNKAL